MQFEGFEDSAGDGEFSNNTVPSSSVGEFDAPGVNPVIADLNALSFSETSRSPYGGDNSRSQGKFRTKDGGKSA